MELNKYIIVKYSELHLKGGNKKQFIRTLIENIRNKLQYHSVEAKVSDGRDRIVINSESDLYKVENLLHEIVGISSFSYYYDVEAKKESVEALLKDILPISSETKFRLSPKVIDVESLGEKQKVIEWLAWFATNELKYKIDLSNYDVDINIKIENNVATIFTHSIKAINGLPAGANGKALTLLSGGIDSPVAAFKTITRGVNSSFITFLTPKTSDKETVSKVIDLAKEVNKYNGISQKLFLVNFEKVQGAIMQLEDTSYRITLLRRYFVRFASMISWKYKFKFLITGDALGQVASQTAESMTLIDNATEQLIVRPLVSMSKNEIIDIARDINTYETSIRPGDDMCSLFTPSNPIIFPKREKVLELEAQLSNIDEVLKDVLENDVRIIDL